MSKQPELMTARQAAKYLRINTQTFDRRIRAMGIKPAARVGYHRTRLFRREDVESFLREEASAS